MDDDYLVEAFEKSIDDLCDYHQKNKNHVPEMLDCLISPEVYEILTGVKLELPSPRDDELTWLQWIKSINKITLGQTKEPAKTYDEIADLWTQYHHIPKIKEEQKIIGFYLDGNLKEEPISRMSSMFDGDMKEIRDRIEELRKEDPSSAALARISHKDGCTFLKWSNAGCSCGSAMEKL